MSKRIGEHLRSNVVGYFAIFLFAIGGTAYATHPGGANTISTVDIINGEVKSPDIATLGVTTPDLADGAVTAIKLGNNSVNSARVQNETLTGVDIANTDSVGSAEVGGLTGGDIADTDSIGSAEVGGLTGGDIADTDSVGSADVGGLTGGDITDGTVTGADLAPVEAVTHPALNPCDGVNLWNNGAALARQVGFFKDRDGVVHLQGSIGCTGNATEGGTIFTLPPGYAPPGFPGGVVRWGALSGGVTISQIAVLESGAVVYDGPNSDAADDYISLDGLTFRP